MIMINTRTSMKTVETLKGPDFAKIYKDIISKKFPEKAEKCRPVLSKKVLTVLDIIKLNQIIFGVCDYQTEKFNQKHKSYDPTSIMEILDYQKKFKLNNFQLADHFKISRNSVTRWKKIFENEIKK